MTNPARSGPTTAFASRAPAMESGGVVVEAGDSVPVVVEPEVGVELGVSLGELLGALLGVSVTVTVPAEPVDDGVATVVVLPVVGSA